MKISIIAALSIGNFAIGNEGKLCYHITNDLKRFRELTMGHTIIMGRKTADTLEEGPLEGRRNIVLSKTGNYSRTEFECFSDLETALKTCQEEEEVFIIGGGQIYKEALPLTNTLYLTEIFDTPFRADTFFPSYHGEFTCKWREYHIDDFLRYEFTIYERD